MPEILLKSDVTLSAASWQMKFILYEYVAPTFFKFGYDCVVTSCNDGAHIRGSKHYDKPCQALDFRTRQINPSKQVLLVKELKQILPSDYQVILERDHLHVEYDPPSFPVSTA